MALKLTSFARRVVCLLAVVLVVLGLSSLAANAGISTGLRNLLQGAMGTDLRVESLVLDKSAASVGETVRATVSISNGGRLAATSTLLTFWAAAGSATSSSNAFRLATVRLGTLQPTNRITYVGTFPVPNFGRSGSYRILATVESSSYESNRQNNTQAKTLQILGPSFSDTDPQPVSDAGPTPPSPPAPGPVASAGGSLPPAPGPGPSSPPASNPVPDAGASPPPASNSGSSSPPASNPAPTLPSPPPPVQAATCDYYASPNGTGNGLSSSSPFKISNFWSVATPGKILCLLDGTYRLATSMIAPPAGLSGASGAPITVRALNDGAVTIDGQFVRRAVSFNNNNWWVLEGFNAQNGVDYLISIDASSSNTIIRRVVGWDVRIDRSEVVIYAAGPNTLIEDSAFFGTGRKIASEAQGGTSTTWRRVWMRWEGNITIGPKFAYQLAYNSVGGVCENCLITWSGESMPQEYDLHHDGQVFTPVQHFTNFGVENPDGLVHNAGQTLPRCMNGRMRGSLVYLKSTDVYPGGSMIQTSNLQCFEFRHTMVFVSPSHSRFNAIVAFALTNSASSSAHNITSVRGSPGDLFGSGWNIQNSSTGTSLGAVANPGTTTGAGANLCKRWVNGVVTNEPLWPWPMNQRIKDATRSAGAYAGPCPTCVGGRAARTETDVTAGVEALLGPVPPQCKSR